ncbi:MAG: hypothetical protein RBU25_00285 [Lentisphaeria bacterium]|jgi:hypothetical protein|nr:hypothetical protein [Lentisphaeria bacterium]
MKRLGFVAVVILGATVTLALLGDRLSSREVAPPPPAPPPVHRAEIELTANGMVPPKLRVPKDHELHLLVRAAPDAPEGVLTVSGYTDLAAGVGIGPGLAREIIFVCRRPGDDFAFVLGGRTVGRLEVTGSHLEEGHQ